MKSEKNVTGGHARVVSAVPGRIRVKIHRTKRNPALMNEVKKNIGSQEGIQDVRLNNHTGSVTVRYDHERHTKETVMKLLEDFDTVFQSLGREAEFEKPEDGADTTLASAGFVEALNDLNRRIYGKTGVPINLKILMPVLFAGAGLWSISRRGLMIEAVPGWLFLWLAFDMFVKLHPSHIAKTG
ncbi:MAG: heavy-metal-associated domain-containing protein [Deltaproteobacteria bacterium]|nr:heavy-metal-associated domain-containing protein [Deltaproteobacteria bacterium]